MEDPRKNDSISITSSSPNGSPRRLVRSLVVHSRATPSGVRSFLYCRVDLPPTTSTNSTSWDLLELLPNTEFISGEVCGISEIRENEGGSEAAQLLGISLEDGQLDGDLSKQDKVQSGRSSTVTKTQEGRTKPKVVQEGDKLVLKYPRKVNSRTEDDPSSRNHDGPSTTDSNELIVVLSLYTPLGCFQNPKFANIITIPTPLCLRNSFRLTLDRPPPLSTGIDPDPSSPPSAWDLKVHPSLSNVESNPHSNASTLITGSFPSTSQLSLRWTRQLPPSAPAPRFVIPRTRIETEWSINEMGWGRAEVKVEGEWEYNGLRDKHWVELRVGVDGESSRGVFEVLEVTGKGVVGWEIVKGSTEPMNPLIENSIEPDTVSLHSSSPSSSPSSPVPDSSITATPTPASTTLRRKRSSYSSKLRPAPKWTSLFDTVPPLVAASPLLDLDSSLMAPDPSLQQMRLEKKEGAGNLLSMEKAPFDPEASAMDMSFEQEEVVEGIGKEEQEEKEQEEVSSLMEPTLEIGNVRSEAEKEEEIDTAPNHGSIEPSVDSQPAPSTSNPSPSGTLIRVQLSLTPLLVPTSASQVPQFSLRLTLDFPVITLRSLTTPSASSSSMRLAIPSFSIPDAVEEESIVTVKAESTEGDEEMTGSKIELVSSSALWLNVDDGVDVEAAQDSGHTRARSGLNPLPAETGTVRWSTVRKRRDGRNPEEDLEGHAAEIEVALPFKERRRRRTSSNPAESIVELNGVAPKIRAKRDTDDSAGAQPRLRRRTRTNSDNKKQIAKLDSSVPPPPSSLMIPLVQIQITPISPTLSLASPSPSDWRIFYRLVFPNSSIQGFTIPAPNDSKVKVHDVWDTTGQSVEFFSEQIGGTGEDDQSEETGLRITPTHADKRIREVLYEERKAGEVVEGAALLPFLDSKVGKYEVEILEAQGYDMNVVVHDFDISTRSKGDSSTFTKFLVDPHTRPFLPLRFRPSTTPQNVSVSSDSFKPTARVLPRKYNFARELFRWASRLFFPILFGVVFVLTAFFNFSTQLRPTTYSPSPPPSVSSQYPLISYSTLYLTTSVVATTTQTQTQILTRTLTLTGTHSPSTITSIRTKYLQAAAEPTPTQSHPTVNPSYHSLSTDLGNSVLVWLERLKLNLRLYLEEMRRVLGFVA